MQDLDITTIVILTPALAHRLGEKYFQAGLKLTPRDCRPIDDAIFAAIGNATGAARARSYSVLRSAFNRGWQQAHAAATVA